MFFNPSWVLTCGCCNNISATFEAINPATSVTNAGCCMFVVGVVIGLQIQGLKGEDCKSAPAGGNKGGTYVFYISIMFSIFSTNSKYLFLLRLETLPFIKPRSRTNIL